MTHPVFKVFPSSNFTTDTRVFCSTLSTHNSSRALAIMFLLSAICLGMILAFCAWLLNFVFGSMIAYLWQGISWLVVSICTAVLYVVYLTNAALGRLHCALKICRTLLLRIAAPSTTATFISRNTIYLGTVLSTIFRAVPRDQWGAAHLSLILKDHSLLLLAVYAFCIGCVLFQPLLVAIARSLRLHCFCAGTKPVLGTAQVKHSSKLHC